MFSVIFDMDGTLLDTQRICIPAWDYAGEKQGFENAGRYIPDVCGMNELGWSSFLKTHFPNINLKQFKTDAREYIVKNLVVRFKDGAKELFDYLKARGIKVGLATGTSRPSVEHHLKEVGIFGMFDAVVCGQEVKNGKPAPDIFLETARQMGINPQDCFVFEDSENGIIAGYKAGMKCIGVADVKPFSPEFKGLMYCELESMEKAIEIFERM
ncbi:MAG: HAD family phosphatase [Ruminococcaceae bacterium]|nr:HAD family phosphatase [Oscillospiraceae bacterium]